MKSSKTLRGLDYHHAPLADQLSAGVRQVEIDVFADPDGGAQLRTIGQRIAMFIPIALRGSTLSRS